jgi:aminodeoxyfutalosine synthase
MQTATMFEQQMQRVAAGQRLAAEEIHELAATPDILPLGMLADTVRRQINGTQVTFVRVASGAFDQPFAGAVAAAAGEVRITGAPATLKLALAGVAAARAAAGSRTVSGYSWDDVARLGAAGQSGPAQVLRELRAAGLDAIAELPLDTLPEGGEAVAALRDAGFDQLTLTVNKAPLAERTALLVRAAEWQQRFGGIRALNPLPLALNAFRPTTGYEDVKMVAVARLAAPGIRSIQVDWLRYGPKLAQVALTFGADDIYGVSAADDAPEGRRRAPLEDIRRNIEAAGFTPVERDGAFGVQG